MTIHHLKLFIDVAEYGSISAAAMQNSLRQPTVSQKIGELEQHYGCLLFERLNNRLHITPTGKRLLPLAKDVVSKFDYMEEYMKHEHHAKSLRVGATLTIGSSIFPQLVKHYREMQPEVELFACISNTAAICKKLLDNTLDVGVVEGLVHDTDLVSLPLIRDYLVLACGKEHPFYHKERVYSHELEQMEFVMREQGSGTRELFEQYLCQHKIHIKTVFEYNNPDAMRSAICVNNCLAVISARLLETEARTGSVRLFQSREKEWNRTFRLVYHKNKHISPAMRAFKTLLEQFEDLEGDTQSLMGQFISESNVGSASKDGESMV